VIGSSGWSPGMLDHQSVKLCVLTKVLTEEEL
jgi:hypothetical protein